jgi:hypothetical protein
VMNQPTNLHDFYERESRCNNFKLTPRFIVGLYAVRNLQYEKTIFY